MNILYIIPYAPTPIRARPYNLIRYMARRDNRITVATLWETTAERQSLDELRTQGIDVIAAPFVRMRKVWNSLRASTTRMPMQAAYCQSPDLERLILAWWRAQHHNIDVVHIEHLRGAIYGLQLKKRTFNGSEATHTAAPVVWDSVDCITYLFEQAAQYSRSLFGRLVTRLELGRTRRYEGWLAGQFNQVLVTSQADKNALEAISLQHSPIRVLPNGVDLSHFIPNETVRQTSTIVFSGKMSYHANITAAFYLVDQVMPLVWARDPEIRLVIAGSAPPPAIRVLAHTYPSRVEVTGYLPDMRAPLQQACVAVAPLLYGAGIQNKVLEAMACGTPVVATSKAVAALSVQSGNQCLTADSPEGFADAIVRLLNDIELRKRLGAAGRDYVERCHDWCDITKRLEAVYQEITQSG